MNIARRFFLKLFPLLVWRGPSLLSAESKLLRRRTSLTGSESFIREGQWKLRHPTRKKDGEVELYDDWETSKIYLDLNSSIPPSS